MFFKNEEICAEDDVLQENQSDMRKRKTRMKNNIKKRESYKNDVIKNKKKIS